MLALLAAAACLQTPPNVLVILMDDVGRDKVTVYGDAPAPPPTPNMDALAAKGVLFRNAWVCQACSPTRASILTGRYTDRTGIGTVIRPQDGISTPLSTAEYLIPEDLPGYFTAAIGKWHLSDTGEPLTHPLDSGFDVHSGFSGATDFFAWNQWTNGVIQPESGYLPGKIAGDTIRALRAMEEPYFVWYSPFLAHSPYHAPPASLHSYPLAALNNNRSRHKAMTESLDTIIGRILANVDLSTTYVFLIGDNGSPGATVEAPFEITKVKGSLYEGGLRVPFIVAGPGVPAGQECDELIHGVDLFATLRELAGFGPPSQGAEDSVSFAPQLTNPAQPGARSYLYAHRFPHPGVSGPDSRAIRTRRWKLYERVAGTTYELYDLVTDPWEEDNLLVTQPGPLSDLLRDRLLGLMPTFP